MTGIPHLGVDLGEWLINPRWATAVLGALSLAACADVSPVASPEIGSSASVAVTPTPAATDCAVLHVERRPGNRLEASIAASTGCAGDLVPRLSKAELRVESGRPMDPIRISIALENASTELDFGSDVGIVLDLSAAITDRGGNAAPNGSPYVVAGNADAVTPASHPVPGAPIWLYGPELDADDNSPARLLESQEKSSPRTLDLRVHPSVKSVTIPIRVHAGAMLYRGLAATLPSDSRVLAIARHKEGSQLAVFGDSIVEGAVFVAPDGQAMTVWIGPDGKPDRAVFPGHVVLFANWDESAVDIAVVKADSSIQIFERVSVQQPPTASTGLRLNRGVSAEPRGLIAVDPFTMAALFKIGSVTISATGCGAASLAAIGTGGLAIPVATVACGSFLLESVSILAPSVGEHPIARTSLDALQITECATGALLDDHCWALVIGMSLEEMAENEALMQRFSVPINQAGLLLRAGSVGGVLELGTLGGAESSALDINGNGQIVGWSSLPNGDTRAFLWSPGTGMRSLGTLGGENSVAYGINDRGEVVGTSQLSNRLWRAFLWSPTGGMRDLGALSGLNSEALDINESGVVVGTDNTTGSKRAFVWTEVGGMRYLALSAEGGTSAAYGINNAGDIVGWTSRCFSCSGTAAHWNAVGVYTQIHPPFFGNPESRALDINDAGQVVGYAYGNRARPFIWPAPDGLQPACLLSGGDGRAQGISNTGRIVGMGSTSFSSPPIYTRPVRCRVGASVGEELPRLSEQEGAVEKINDSGYAVGFLSNAKRQVRAVRWRLP